MKKKLKVLGMSDIIITPGDVSETSESFKIIINHLKAAFHDSVWNEFTERAFVNLDTIDVSAIDKK